MKNLQLIIFFFISVISFRVGADECPYSIENASVMLTLPNKVNMKITSAAMCNQKEYFADRFFDADVEVWKEDKLVGKFYSRRVSYDVKNLKLILQGSLFIESELITNAKFKSSSSFMIVDLKKGKISSSVGEVRFL